MSQLLALIWQHMGFVAHHLDDYATARQRYEASLALWRTMDHKWGLAETLGTLGVLAYRERDYETARSLQEESLQLKQTLGDQRDLLLPATILPCLAIYYFWKICGVI